MKNKKKLVIILVLLLLAVGFAGYGVYSYYWAEGSVTQGDNYPTISLTRQFYPVVDIDGSQYYLGESRNIDLTCPTPSDGDTSVTCTGSLVVYNDSTERISLWIDEQNATTYSGSDKVSLGEPSFSYSQGYISPRGTTTVNFSVVATLGTGDEPEQVYEPVTGEEVSVSINFDIKATQYHSNGY
jgi:hypothetical protein